MERVLFAPRELPQLGPDVAHDTAAYSGWVQARERQRSLRSKRTWRTRRSPLPELQFVMPVLGAPLASVERTLRGLLAQTARRWALTVVCGDERITEVGDLMSRVVPRRLRDQARSLVCATAGVADQVWDGIRACAGEPLALVFPGDVWARDAVELLGASLTPNGIVYADDDVLAADGTYVSPRLKPDYSPDLLLASSYIGAPLVIGPNVARQLERPTGTSPGAIEHELAMAASEVADSVHHVAEVLCHRSPWDAAELDTPAAAEQVRAALKRRMEDGDVGVGNIPGTYRIVRSTPADASVSVIVPFRDQPRFLRTCVDSVTNTSHGANVEFVLIDNGSTDPEVLTLLERLDARADVRVVADPRPFNWAALNNAAARIASGDVLLFLNNDIEALTPGWLDALVGHACRPDVAAVGARLVYPDRRLQHCGVVVGLIGAAGHPLIGLCDGEPGYMNMAVVTRECSAVTGACMATRREVFDSLQGFDEALGVDLNDVDYCLRGLAAGFRTVYEPGAELIHHESPSRGTAGGAADILKFVERWQDYISAGDPYLNRNLTRSNASCGLASSEEKERWNQWYSTLGRQ